MGSGLHPTNMGEIWILVVAHCFIILTIVLGNVLTVIAIFTSKKLSSTISNQFVFSLAFSDLLVGLSDPYHLIYYLVNIAKKSELNCLLRFTFITFACASSIFNLLIIAIDRYVAIIHPLKYNRYMTRKFSAILISLGWIASFSLGTMCLYWNEWSEDKECDWGIIPQEYIYLMAPMFITTWSTMVIFYLKICKEAKSHVKRMKTITNINCISGLNESSKSVQMVLMILGCFSLCWMPFFCITIYLRTNNTEECRVCWVAYEIAFGLAIGNSALNPVIYAWKNSNFRKAFTCLLTCKSPNSELSSLNYITNHVPSKKGSMDNLCDGKSEDYMNSECEIKMNGETSRDYDRDSGRTAISEITL